MALAVPLNCPRRVVHKGYKGSLTNIYLCLKASQDCVAISYNRCAISGFLFRYDIGINIEISILFSIILIAWADDIYKYAWNTIYTLKLLHRTNNKPRKLVDKLLKWLDSTEPTLISSVIAQPRTKCCWFNETFFDISIIIAKYNIFDKYLNVLK